MSKLERWLPFKFRHKNEQQAQETQPASREQASPAQTSALSPLLPFNSPFFGTPVHQLVQNLFNDPFFRDPFGQSEQLDRWFGDYSPRRFSPSVEVSDDSKAIKVTVELPGMSKEDVKIQIEDGMLVVTGDKRHEEEGQSEGVFRTERYYGYFRRAIPLPEDIDEQNADAEFKKGLLTIRLPKVEPTTLRSRRIEVKG